MKYSSKASFRKGISDANSVVVFVLLLFGSSATAPAQTHRFSPDVYSTSSVDIGDVSNNYWGGGALNINGSVSYTHAFGDITSSCPTRPTVYCSGGLIMFKRHPIPLSVVDDTSVTHCDSLFSKAYYANQDGNYQESYDTARYFVEHCDTNSAALMGIGLVKTDVDAGAGGPFPDRYVSQKHWLLSLLPMRHDNGWFCTIADVLIGSLATKVDTTWAQISAGTNQGLGLVKYLLDNNLCPHNRDNLIKTYDDARGSQRETWISTQDTSKVKLDTTLPSMHDLGLDSVLKYAAMLGVHDANIASTISSAVASPNPLGEGTTITFGMSKEAFVKIAVFDLLGNVVVSGFESVLEPGNHSVPISLHNLPSGTYYARIMTTYGEVQTVKLAKE